MSSSEECALEVGRCQLRRLGMLIDCVYALALHSRTLPAQVWEAPEVVVEGN